MFVNGIYVILEPLQLYHTVHIMAKIIQIETHQWHQSKCTKKYTIRKIDTSQDFVEFLKYITSLRVLISDRQTDLYTFQADPFPTGSVFGEL